MFWWFQRGEQFLRYEVNNEAGAGYVLRVIEPDGTEHAERFAHSDDLNNRQIEFERQLAAKGWTGPHGWNV